MEKYFIKNQQGFMGKIIKLHDRIKDLHESLLKLYPITIINNDYFYVFEFKQETNQYEYILKNKTPMPISGKILAAFSLDFYNMKPSAIISNDILENEENHVTIFHEFVHCFQLENGELDIRNELLIEKQEKAKNNYSWELNYPFPYENEYFVENTSILSNIEKDLCNYIKYHNNMKSKIKNNDFEYMIWQEWKEGFARYIENLIRKSLNKKLNSTEIKPPFGRVHFYEIGSNYIELLIEENKELEKNIKALYHKMYSRHG
jgi:hypothetical protein